MSYLGLDIGTSGCKAVIFEQDGTVLSSSFREYLLKTPHPGWSELDSGEVIDNCFRVIREAVKDSAAPVKAMGISSQGEAFTPVGKDGEILANAMVSSDNRAVKSVNDFCDLFGRESKKLYSGNLSSYDFPLPETYTTVAFSLTGGNILKWFRDEFGEKEIDEAKKSGKDPYSILVDHLPGNHLDFLVCLIC